MALRKLLRKSDPYVLWSTKVFVRFATALGRSLSTGTQFSLQKVNFESASKVVPNDCNDMFWCISITNNVKSCKKFSEKAQTGKITVFTMVNQHCGAENMEK